MSREQQLEDLLKEASELLEEYASDLIGEGYDAYAEDVLEFVDKIKEQVKMIKIQFEDGLRCAHIDLDNNNILLEDSSPDLYVLPIKDLYVLVENLQLIRTNEEQEYYND